MVRVYVLAAGFLATIVAANWAIGRFGLVPVGFGLVAPAGVYFAGLAFGLRDALHESAGRWWVVAAIVAGAALSYVVAPARIAVASGLAFGLSELADLAVYEPLRRRRWTVAVAASNVVGAVVDSFVFLALAGLPLALWRGQVLGKAWMILPVLPVVYWTRRRRVVSRESRPAVA